MMEATYGSDPNEREWEARRKTIRAVSENNIALFGIHRLKAPLSELTDLDQSRDFVGAIEGAYGANKTDIHRYDLVIPRDDDLHPYLHIGRNAVYGFSNIPVNKFREATANGRLEINDSVSVENENYLPSTRRQEIKASKPNIVRSESSLIQATLNEVEFAIDCLTSALEFQENNDLEIIRTAPFEAVFFDPIIHKRV
jgi:hypothetical protein